MSTDKKTIDAYNKFAQSWVNSKHNKQDRISIFHTYLEKPALYGKLPNLKDKTILCIGCGSGEEMEYLHNLGPKKVIGIDISSELITIAKKNYPTYEFYIMDAESLDFPSESFDIVFSSLTLHYLKTWTKALKLINKVLTTNGIFLFSITHPFFSATQREENEEIKSRIFGYEDHKKTNNCKIYGDYLNYKKLEIYIGKDLIVTNHHRSLSTIIKEIVSSGFELIDMAEPKALNESKTHYQTFWEIHQKIPEFIIFELRKK